VSASAALAAPVVAVTVLEDRAQVTRRGTARVAAGQQRVVIEGVSPVLVDKTLLCTAAGARVLDVRCERYVAPWRDVAVGSTELAATLRAELAVAVASRATADARARAAHSESSALDELLGAAMADLAVAATRGTASGDADARLAALDAQAAAARARRVEAELAVQDAAGALARLHARVNRAVAQAGEDAARIVIDLAADAPGDATITCGYVVPGAAWRPYHRARLVRDSAATVEWETTACVWQATGEDWPEAQLTFSLERPSLGVEPPELADDEVRARRRPDTVTVEARDQEHQTTGLGGGGGPREVPGIDDGGLGLVLRGARAITVRADGAPHRVPIGGFTSPAELALVAIPLRSPWVHVRARLTNAGSSPILAGPVDLILAAGYVGRAEVGFVATGERVDVGFGPEADVRVHRDETRTRDDAGLLGGWNVQTVRVALRLSNLGTTARDIAVTERVPVSEVERVEIVTSPPDAFQLGIDDEPTGELIQQVSARQIDARGLVTWQVALPARGRRAVTLEYKIKSRRDVEGV